MTTITVEQLLIGWSRTSNGKNVLARSPGWPSEPSRGEWVSTLGDFLHPEIDRIVRRTGEVPWLLEFLPSDHGSILMAKVYAAESLRAGEFQVHALLDPSRTLGPQHLPVLAEAGVLLQERPADVTSLDTRRLTVPPVPAAHRVRPVALAVQFLHRGGPLLTSAATLTDAADLLGELATALPAPVAARTPARSVITDAATAHGIAVTVPPWTRGADAVPAAGDTPVPDVYLELAERLIAGELTLPEAGPHDLAEWLDLAVLDPETLTADELALGLSGGHAAQWLETALAEPRTRDLLFRLIRTGGVPWSEWTDEAWLQWLESDSELWSGLQETIDAEGFADRFAGLLDRLPRRAVDQALAQLSRWPADRLGVLTDALMRSRNTSPELLIQTLDRLPADDVRRLVQRNWPMVGRQLGLPASVVQALKPNRSWLAW